MSERKDGRFLVIVASDKYDRSHLHCERLKDLARAGFRIVINPAYPSFASLLGAVSPGDLQSDLDERLRFVHIIKHWRSKERGHCGEDFVHRTERWLVMVHIVPRQYLARIRGGVEQRALSDMPM